VDFRVGGGQITAPSNSPNLTRHWNLGGAAGNGQTPTNILFAQSRIRASFNAKNLFWLIATNSLNVSATLSFNINGSASSNLTITVAATTTGIVEDLDGTDALVANDLVCWQITVPAGTGTIATALYSIVLSHAGTVSIMGTGNPGAGGEGYAPFGSFGATGSGVTEAERRMPYYSSAVFSNLFIHVSVNTRDGATTLVSRVNSGAGAMTLTIGAAATGQFEDVDNSDVISFGDFFATYSVIGGSSGTFTYQTISFHSTRGHTYSHIGAGALSSLTYGAIGSGTQLSTTEADTQVITRLGTSYLRYLSTQLSANTRDATTTCALRRNGSSVITISIGAGATGTISELDTVVTLADTDKINFMFDASPGTTGSVSFRSISVHQVLPNDLEGFRFRNDDGSESTASWLAAQDANLTRDKALTTRLRTLVDTYIDTPSEAATLQWRKVGDPDSEWRTV
jgi:hypothetical protein